MALTGYQSPLRTSESMKYIVLAFLLFGTSPVLGGDGPSWKSLKLGTSTLDQVVYRFGAPDSVRTDFSWADFGSHQSRPRRLQWFSLVYLPLRGTLPIHSGPLGMASTTTLDFDGDRLMAILWEYQGPTASAAFHAWLADSTLQLKANDKLLLSSKAVGDTLLFVSCPTADKPLFCSDAISVSLMLSPRDISKR